VASSCIGTHYRLQWKGSTGGYGSILTQSEKRSRARDLWYFTLESVERMAHALGLRIERYDHPWKIVPISLIGFQIRRMLGMRTAGTSTTSRVGLPVNLFDAMRIALRKSA
jgi:hypothetical protein